MHVLEETERERALSAKHEMRTDKLVNLSVAQVNVCLSREH